MLRPQKAKGTGWLQCNNNSDRLNAREKQLPCQRASASTVPTAEEKVRVGNRKTKQSSPLKCRETKAQGRRSVFRSAPLQHVRLERSSPAGTALAGIAAVGSNVVSQVPRGVSGLTFPPGILCPHNRGGSVFAPHFICLGSGLPFFKAPFSAGRDFPKDKHFFHCQDHP